jgi:hypothetical protein
MPFDEINAFVVPSAAQLVLSVKIKPVAVYHGHLFGA